MKRSPEFVGLVPNVLVTVTSTVPVPAGAFTRSVVELRSMAPGARTPPKCTVMAPMNCVPVTVIGEPAVAGVGVTETTVGLADGAADVTAPFRFGVRGPPPGTIWATAIVAQQQTARAAAALMRDILAVVVHVQHGAGRLLDESNVC